MEGERNAAAVRASEGERNEAVALRASEGERNENGTPTTGDTPDADAANIQDTSDSLIGNDTEDDNNPGTDTDTDDDANREVIEVNTDDDTETSTNIEAQTDATTRANTNRNARRTNSRPTVRFGQFGQSQRTFSTVHC